MMLDAWNAIRSRDAQSFLLSPVGALRSWQMTTCARAAIVVLSSAWKPQRMIRSSFALYDRPNAVTAAR